MNSISIIQLLVSALMTLFTTLVMFNVKQLVRKIEVIVTDLQKALTNNEVQNNQIKNIEKDIEVINNRLNSHSENLRELKENYLSCKHCNTKK